MALTREILDNANNSLEVRALIGAVSRKLAKRSWGRYEIEEYVEWAKEIIEDYDPESISSEKKLKKILRKYMRSAFEKEGKVRDRKVALRNLSEEMIRYHLLIRKNCVIERVA